MLRFTVLVSSLLMALMSARGISSVKKLFPRDDLPKLAAVYLESFPVATGVLLLLFLVMLIQTTRGPRKSRYDLQALALIALQLYALAGVSGLFVCLFDHTHMIGSQPAHYARSRASQIPA
ncbi:hypothetical protein [Prosthecobacter sp.]|uniref:hypothetical protein n=1 Tax=Prosthecobacter sp. TaxID=1965333 RepID=UPI0037831FE5